MLQGDHQMTANLWHSRAVPSSFNASTVLHLHCLKAEQMCTLACLGSLHIFKMTTVTTTEDCVCWLLPMMLHYVKNRQQIPVSDDRQENHCCNAPSGQLISAKESSARMIKHGASTAWV